MLLFRNTGTENYERLPADERQELLGRWNIWLNELFENGKATEGAPLELETRTISGPAGSRITDGPYAEAKEAVGGYVKLRVRDWEEATAIAKAHPALDYGLEIEIRQMVTSCHLGVQARV